jgi:hypothetical protein
MPACSNPPNRPPRDVIDRLIDDVAWAKTCMLICAATTPGSSERDHEMQKLRQAVIEPRRAVDEILGCGQAVPRDVLIELRTCELAIPQLEAGAVLRQPSATTPGEAP